MVKLVVSDIDGTLVGDGQGLNFCHRNIFRKLKDCMIKGFVLWCAAEDRDRVLKRCLPGSR